MAYSQATTSAPVRRLPLHLIPYLVQIPALNPGQVLSTPSSLRAKEERGASYTANEKAMSRQGEAELAVQLT